MATAAAPTGANCPKHRAPGEKGEEDPVRKQMPRLKLRLVRGLGHRIRISMGRSDVYLGHADITAVILNGMPLDPSGYPTNRCVTYWCFVQTFRWYRASGDMELHERALSNLINACCRQS